MSSESLPKVSAASLTWVIAHEAVVGHAGSVILAMQCKLFIINKAIFRCFLLSAPSLLCCHSWYSGCSAAIQGQAASTQSFLQLKAGTQAEGEHDDVISVYRGEKTKLDGVSKWSISVEKFGLMVGRHLHGRGLSDVQSR